MFLEIVHAEGLSQLSYIVGDAGSAAVIDPRRDCKIYVDIARRHGAQITHIFETHRHEDFVVGSLELARRTKAKIFHGKALVFQYGKALSDGDVLNIGNWMLKIIETPGHTPESICIVLSDRVYSERPVGVFTGDTLLIGNVGRADLYPEMGENMAGKLYDSLHNKVLPLGDHVLLYPGHGQGSICGGQIAARSFSTLGYEKMFNPMLTKSRNDFIQEKEREEHYYPPYFRQMERLNQDGIPLVAKLPEPRPEGAADFVRAIKKQGLFVLDVRSPEAFAGGHIPGSICVPLDRLAHMAGWFLPYDRKIGLVLEKDEDAAKAKLFLMRMGFDNLDTYLAGGLRAWAAAGNSITSIPVLDSEGLRQRVLSDREPIVLDVRSHGESVEISSEPSYHVWIGDLPYQMEGLPRDRTIITFCSNGRRAIIAASLLQHAHFEHVEVYLGSDRAYEALRIKDKGSRRAA